MAVTPPPMLPCLRRRSEASERKRGTCENRKSDHHSISPGPMDLAMITAGAYERKEPGTNGCAQKFSPVANRPQAL